MSFLTEDKPPRHIAIPALPGISRIVAANPGVMTYHGTNTWLIEDADGITVLDPGPDSAEHVADIIRLAEGGTAASTPARIVRILLSHTHRDHLGAVAALRAATGVPVAAFHRSAEPEFTPDIPLEDGAHYAGMVALHTPGHAADHLCFARPGGVLFSADHVMSWSSSVVSPPGGNMGDYFASLRRLLARDDTLYLPGHGPPLREARALVAEMLAHRTAREEAIAAALDRAPVATQALVDRLYSQVHPTLRRAAERNVIAHLLKLEGEGRAVRAGNRWVAA